MQDTQLSQISNFIWGVADDLLRDVYVRGKYRDVILPMTVLRRLDAVLEPTKQKVLDEKKWADDAGIENQAPILEDAAGQSFYNTSPFGLKDLTSRASQQQLRDDFNTYLDGFSPNVQDILEKFEFRNQLGRLSTGDVLGNVVTRFLSPQINLSPEPVLNPDGSVRLPGLDNHAIGTIFEDLVRRFNEENEHWGIQRLKTVCGMKSGEGITGMSIEDEGEYPVYGGNGLRGYTSEFTHDGKYVLIGRQGALCGNVHIARGQFWASEHAVITTLYENHVLEWLSGLLEVMNLNQYSIAAAQPGLAVERVMNLWIPVPPHEEQKTIAASIGTKTKRTDNTVKQARSQTDLMNEYRTRLIADVVTGQLDVREAAAQLPAAP